MHTPGDRQALTDAFEALPGKGGLGSIALDSKVERFLIGWYSPGGGSDL